MNTLAHNFKKRKLEFQHSTYHVLKPWINPIGCLLFFEIFLTYNCKDACMDSINFSQMNRISQWQIWLVLLHTNKCIEDHTMWLLRINVNPIYGHWLEGDYLYILRQPLVHPKAPVRMREKLEDFVISNRHLQSRFYFWVVVVHMILVLYFWSKNRFCSLHMVWGGKIKIPFCR